MYHSEKILMDGTTIWHKQGIIMTIDEMRSRKRELGYSNKKLSELSGVPVGIWEGKCMIDFKEVFTYAGFLYDEDIE